MPDLHGWITQQIDAVEGVARAATEGPWFADHPEPRHWGDDPESALIVQGKPLCILDGERNGPLNADHIVLHSPDNVLRRCAADRKILAEHCPQGNGYSDHYACDGCGYDGSYCPEPITAHVNDCPTLLALAEGYGLTEEQRAALDRPEPERPVPSGQSFVSASLAEALYGNLIATFIGTRPMEPSPAEKAVKILEPELKKIILYVPIAEETP